MSDLSLTFADPEGKWTPHKVDQALWSHYLARELKPELLEGMPKADGNERNHVKSEDSPDITSTVIAPTITVTNGETLSDENSSGPSSDPEDKSNDSTFKNGNGTINGEDSNIGSELNESEDSRLVSEENSLLDDNAVDSSEPAFKKQRVDPPEISAVVVGEDAQL